ncbi:MAG: ArgR family transcriptional regulator [Deltaproteobacteria bacterium]|nr:ArgR family transcriptional regulator [Deltaproteobacteria bacterium]
MKAIRHEAIQRLVQEQDLPSQDDLRRALRKEGIKATQATLSRDIAELGIVRARDGYRLPGQVADAPSVPEGGLQHLLREFMRDATAAGNMVVIKTPAGAAGALGLAVDKAGLPGIVGTVAGDDIILAVARSASAARGLQKRLLDLVRPR